MISNPANADQQFIDAPATSRLRATEPDRSRGSLLAPLLATALALFGSLDSARAADWPQFRGPERTGISSETGLDLEWPASGPEVIWRRVSGEGFSGLSIVDGKVFTQLALNGREYLFAIDRKTGRDVWRLDVDEVYENNFGNGPRSTPTIAGGVVYAVSALGRLVAAEASSGKLLWQRDLRSEVKAKVPTWGISTSVTVVGEVLLLDVGGENSIVGLHISDGRKLWGALNDIAGYSAPIVETIAGKKQAVFFTGSRIASLDPSDGKVLWTFPWKTQYDVNAATPIFIAPNRVFVASGYDHGGAVLEVSFEGDEASVREVWSSRDIKNQFSSSIYHDNHIYGFDEKILKCLDARTGEERWKARGYGHGSLLLADGHLIVLGDRGRLGVVEATPEGFREGSTLQALEGKSWTVPTLSDGQLFLRNEKEMVAFDLTP